MVVRIASAAQAKNSHFRIDSTCVRAFSAGRTRSQPKNPASTETDTTRVVMNIRLCSLSAFSRSAASTMGASANPGGRLPLATLLILLNRRLASPSEAGNISCGREPIIRV